MLAGLLVALIVAGSLILPAVLPYRYDQQSLDRTFAGPSRQHWLGTDQYGRDLLTRLAQGGRISLVVGVVTVLAEVLLGGFLGGIAGYAGGTLDEWLMRLTDMMLAFPALLLPCSSRPSWDRGRPRSSRPSPSPAGPPWPARCAARC